MGHQSIYGCPVTIKTEKWRKIKPIEHNQWYTLVKPRYRAYRVFIFISFAVFRACATWLTCGVLLFGFLCCYSLILGAWLSGIQGRQRLFVLSRTIRLRCPIRSRPGKRIENIETRQPSFHRDIDPQNYTPQIKTILKNKATIYLDSIIILVCTEKVVLNAHINDTYICWVSHALMVKLLSTFPLIEVRTQGWNPCLSTVSSSIHCHTRVGLGGKLHNYLQRSFVAISLNNDLLIFI